MTFHIVRGPQILAQLPPRSGYLFLIIQPCRTIVADGSVSSQGISFVWTSSPDESTPFDRYDTAHFVWDLQLRDHLSRSLFELTRIIRHDEALIISTMQS